MTGVAAGDSCVVENIGEVRVGKFRLDAKAWLLTKESRLLVPLHEEVVSARVEEAKSDADIIVR